MRHRLALRALSHSQLTVIGGAALVLALAILVFAGEPLSGRATEVSLPAARPPAAIDRLRIPAIGVDVPLGVRQVTQDGGLPFPPRSMDAIWYDFSLHPGLGGVPGVSGNTVLTGRGDANTTEGHLGVHYTGPAAFTDLGLLHRGDRIEVSRGGETTAYQVVSVDILNEEHADWSAVFASTPAEMLTLFKCTGVFDTHELDYVDKVVVKAALVLQ